MEKSRNCVFEFLSEPCPVLFYCWIMFSMHVKVIICFMTTLGSPYSEVLVLFIKRNPNLDSTVAHVQ